MARDRAGNSLNQAKMLTLGATQRERVGKLDRDDFYSFSLANTSSVRVSLRSSGARAGLELIQDRNSNGLVDAGEVVRSVRARSKASSLSTETLSNGTYFLRVYSQGSGETNYRLMVAAQPVLAGEAVSNEGSGSGTANPGSVPTTATPPTDSQTPTILSTFVDKVVQLTNVFRQQNGLSALTVNTRLNQAAQTQSQNMALQDFFDHTGLDGSHPWDRMTAAGYRWSRAAENIAAGQMTPDEVVTAWINSPGHRANMLDPNVREIGVGYYNLVSDTGNVNYNRYWTQVFGAPA